MIAAKPDRSSSLLKLAILFLFGGFPLLLGAERQAVESEEFMNRLEWRGIMTLPEEQRFSVHDTENRQSFWVSLGEVRSGVEVIRYDAEAQEITLRHGKATRVLSMSSSHLTTLDEKEMDRLSSLWREVIAKSSDLDEIDRAFRLLNNNVIDLSARSDQQRARLSGIPEPNVTPDMDRAAAVAQDALRRDRKVQTFILKYLEDRTAAEVEKQEILTEEALAVIRNSPSISREIRSDLEAGIEAGFLLRLESKDQPAK